MSNLQLSWSSRREVERFALEMQRYGRGLERGTTTLEEFVDWYPPGLAKVRRLIGLQPVPVNGAQSGYFQMPLRDGTAGYFQRRADDCLQAAIASCAQIPMPLVPDLLIDRQRVDGTDPEEIELVVWQKLSAWMEQHRRTIMIHPVPPTSARRWIGIVPSYEGLYADHALLMSGRDCLFDPSNPVPPGKNEPASDYDVHDVEYGITIEKR